MNPPRLFLLLPLLALTAFADERPAVEVSSLAELAEAAAKSGQVVTLKAGVYRVADELPPRELAERRKRGEFSFLRFSGDNNEFRLAGVTLEVDTELRAAVRAPIHTDEIVVTGANNVLEGLTIRHLGDRPSLGGAALGLVGKGNTLRGCSLTVRGSHPYGYGDLFGKGGPNVIPPLKKSGVHITGHGSRLIDCTLVMRAFGHGYFVQEDAEDVRFENCTVEGALRTTDEMLAEKAGPAFDVNFQTVVTTRDGSNKIAAGYQKSMSEDGFRTYGRHRGLVLKNCVAKHMRSGFELRTDGGVTLENCVAIGNERGFWVGTDAVVRDCRGDARFGPLLFVEGERSAVELTLLPAESEFKLHALAVIGGKRHQITLKPAGDGARKTSAPILVGYAPPMMGDAMAPIHERKAEDFTLINATKMPVILSAACRRVKVETAAEVEDRQPR